MSPAPYAELLTKSAITMKENTRLSQRPLYLFLNLLGPFAAIFVSAYVCFFSRGSLSELPASVGVNVVALAAIVLILPDFIHGLLPKARWYLCPEAMSIYLLVLLALVGYFVMYDDFWMPCVSWLAGAVLIIWNITKAWRVLFTFKFLVGLCLVLLLFLLFFSRGYESPVFAEKIVLGQAHIDVLFCSSISAMISTYGVASTGLDGYPYYAYHWGSHALLAGLKNWTGCNYPGIYLLMYPAVFIGLFVKALIGFMHRYFRFKGKGFWLLAVLSMLCLLYSLPFMGFADGTLASSSFGVAIMFSFLMLSVLLDYIHSRSAQDKGLIVWTFALLLLISFCKISTGFVLTIGLAWLGFRVFSDVTLRVLMVALLVILAAMVYMIVFPEGRLAHEAGLLSRYYGFWMLSDSFVTYTLGIIIPLLILMKLYRLDGESIVRVFRSRKFLDLEMLILMTLSGLAAGMLVSQNASDVHYFAKTQIFLVLPLIILVVQEFWKKQRAVSQWKTGTLVVVALLSIAARPDLWKYKDGILEPVLIRDAMTSLNPDQVVLRDLLLSLQELSRNSGRMERSGTCIYIPLSESWYYESQKRYELASLFVVPAVSGISMINGVSEDWLESEMDYYSLYFYEDEETIGNSEMAFALRQAREWGFTRMAIFVSREGRLYERVIQL